MTSFKKEMVLLRRLRVLTKVQELEKEIKNGRVVREIPVRPKEVLILKGNLEALADIVIAEVVTTTQNGIM
jgi:hypothetical protein